MDNQTPQLPIFPSQQIEPEPQVIKVESGKFEFLTNLVRYSLFLNVAFGILIIIASILLILASFDLLAKGRGSSTDNLATLEGGIETPEVRVAEAAPYSQIFINEQSIDIEKAFSGEKSKTIITVQGQLKREVFGFLPYWAVSKLGEIDTKLLTSISYFGLEVDRNGDIIKTDSSGKPLDPWVKFQSDSILHAFFKNAKKNKIKVYVTLKCFSKTNMIDLVTDEGATSNFIKNALYLIESKSLDGINLDFEYIGTPSDEVRDGFSLLVSKLNKELKRQYPDALLTIDTFVDAAANTRIHDIPVLAENSDGLVIMGYDFHTPNSTNPGPVAPMEGSGLSIVGLMSSYLEKAPADKLILAVPYYGYDWVEGGGNRADVKILSYAEITDSSSNSQINWDENAKTPWYNYNDPKTNQKREVHFENTRSLGIKYDFINSKELGGVGVWALGFDGFKTELNQLLADKFAN